jgi:hypothetical protein
VFDVSSVCLFDYLIYYYSFTIDKGIKGIVANEHLR